MYTPFSKQIILSNITYRKVLPLTCLALWNILHKCMELNNVHLSLHYLTSKMLLEKLTTTSSNLSLAIITCIPHHINNIIKSLYTDFQSSIITSKFCTPFIHVGRGVLQGDCLSPLLFNMCFNTYIQHIKAEKYRQFGFSLQFLTQSTGSSLPMMLQLLPRSRVGKSTPSQSFCYLVPMV